MSPRISDQGQWPAKLIEAMTSVTPANSAAAIAALQ
jgi:hypothetical protein